MADLGFQFNPGEVSDDYELLPDGDYPAVITKSEVKPNKAGTGHYLELSVEIIDGEYKGRRIFDIINIRNQNPKAEAIAHRTLKRICESIGVGLLKDSYDLHDKELTVSVATEAGDGKYKDKNKIKEYGPARGVSPVARPAAAPPVRAAPVPIARAQAQAPAEVQQGFQGMQQAPVQPTRPAASPSGVPAWRKK